MSIPYLPDQAIRLEHGRETSKTGLYRLYMFYTQAIPEDFVRHWRFCFFWTWTHGWIEDLRPIFHVRYCYQTGSLIQFGGTLFLKINMFPGQVLKKPFHKGSLGS